VEYLGIEEITDIILMQAALINLLIIETECRRPRTRSHSQTNSYHFSFQNQQAPCLQLVECLLISSCLQPLLSRVFSLLMMLPL